MNLCFLFPRGRSNFGGFGENAMTNIDAIRPAETPLAHSIEDAARITTCGRTSIYAAIKEGALKARKVGRRTLILDSDLRAWLAALPTRKAA